jgi:hypothetical protein
VGAVRNNVSGDFQTFSQRGGLVNRQNRVSIFTDGSATSLTLVDLSNTVPTTADSVLLELATRDLSTDTSRIVVAVDDASSEGSAMSQNPGGVTAYAASTAEIALATAQTVWYKVETASNLARLSVVGWRY